jgi:HEAT repeat protein
MMERTIIARRREAGCETDLYAITDRVINGLLKLLRSASWKDRLHASRALISLGSKAVDGLLKAIDEHDGMVQWVALETLGEIRTTSNRSAADALLTLVKHNNRQVRKKAVELLGESRDPRVVNDLLQALRDEGIEVQYAADEVLDIMGEQRGVESPVEGLARHGMPVHWPILDSLINIGGAAESRNPRRRATDRAVAELLAALKNSHWKVRLKAVAGLEEANDPGSVDGLL